MSPYQIQNRNRIPLIMHSIYYADMRFKNISSQGLVPNNFRGIES